MTVKIADDQEAVTITNSPANDLYLGNAEAVLEENSNGKSHKDKVYIEAIRDIKAGEELSYNYGIVLDEPHTSALKKLWACHCGSPKCTGTMLQPKRKPKAKKKR